HHRLSQYLLPQPPGRPRESGDLGFPCCPRPNRGPRLRGDDPVGVRERYPGSSSIALNRPMAHACTTGLVPVVYASPSPSPSPSPFAPCPSHLVFGAVAFGEGAEVQDF